MEPTGREELLELWRDATRAAELADRLVGIASATSIQADADAASEDIAQLAERAAEAAARAAQRAREAADAAAAAATPSRDTHLADAEEAVRTARPDEADVKRRYDEASGR